MRRRNDWIQVRTRAVEQAERLAAECSGGRFPTALHAIARERRVTDIRFRPLLTEGSLSIEQAGFVITLSCWPELIEKFTARFEEDGTGKLLPRRTRFSLAHEIAHTFFFDLKRLPPRSKYDLSVPQTLHALERSCNRVAGALLLPRSMLENEIANQNILEPKALLDISHRASIARGTLVSQLGYTSAAYQPRGFVLSGRFEDSHPVVEAVWRHYSFHSLFSDVQPSSPLSAFFKNNDPYKELWVFGGTASAVDFRVRMEGGSLETWTMLLEDRLDRELASNTRYDPSFFLTVFRSVERQ